MNRNNWECGLGEAAFMTGLERNADVVRMASYAPLFAHVDGWQWTPDLIWFDNLRSYGTPDYYVQKLYASNRGSIVVPITGNGQPLTGQDSLYGSAVFDSVTSEIIIKLVNATAYAKDIIIRWRVFAGCRRRQHTRRSPRPQQELLTHWRTQWRSAR